MSSAVIGTEVVRAFKVKDFARIHATMEESKKILAESRRQLGRASAIVRALQELEVTICCTPRPRVTRCFRKGEPRLSKLQEASKHLKKARAPQSVEKAHTC